MSPRPLVIAMASLAALSLVFIYAIQDVTSKQLDALDDLAAQLSTQQTSGLDTAQEQVLSDVRAAREGCLQRAIQAVDGLRDVNEITTLGYERREEKLLRRLGVALEGCAAESSAAERSDAAAALWKASADRGAFVSAGAMVLLLEASAARDRIEEASFGERSWDVLTGATAKHLDSFLEERQRLLSTGALVGTTTRELTRPSTLECSNSALVLRLSSVLE